MTEQPPLLSSPKGIRLLVRAQQFWFVGKSLPNMHGIEPNWPKWFLMTHAIELAIKAFIVSRKRTAPHNHDLVGLYKQAVQLGWKRNPLVMEGLPHLSELLDHYARYPHERIRAFALLAQFDEPIDDMVQQLLDDIAEAVDPRRRPR